MSLIRYERFRDLEEAFRQMSGAEEKFYRRALIARAGAQIFVPVNVG